MNGITKAALIIGGLYVVYRLWEKGGAASALTASVKKIKYGGSDLSKTWFTVDLGIINPSGESFSFTRFFGQLRINGEVLATATKDGTGEGVIIRPASETVVSFPVYINHLSTLTTLKTVITQLLNKQPLQGLDFNGMLYVGSFGIPISQRVDLNFSSTPAPAIKGPCFTCARPSVSGVLN